jgi:nicotinate-nucleotide adenylyltransferase
LKKIGIFSGTFDPVHEGHITFANEACRQAGLDKVFLLVEPRPRRKQGVRALEHRTEMVKRAIAQDPKLGLLVLEQARFTVSETLPVLQARFKGAQLYFLTGDDMIKHFNDQQWPGINDFIASVRFLIGLRDQKREELADQIKTLEKVRHIKLHYELFASPEQVLSSRNIRTSLRKGFHPHGMHPEVLDYIQAEGLYSSAEEA